MLMALSTSTAVTGFANSMFGAVNNLLGMSTSEPAPLPTSLEEDLDMSDVRIPRAFSDTFGRMLRNARGIKKASIKLDELIQIDKTKVRDIDQMAHFFEMVRRFTVVVAFQSAACRRRVIMLSNLC